ncbi:hypothetical protein SM124_15685 [Bacillus sp. 31A1R]|uniref:Uncharacterized protein n=1 Tax=Robertmurraya mangrovi TaxID=3098077 RepID=A0ABU5J180_9BACI|nr:hypothetical protein [Bacillus sp. 31A1R]MDZ5473159.1 hypothetical protein [Bacillus sp. 31A1R]
MMFDPTAFENMKVVIEGELYDRDLGGEITVTDRNDLVNLAKLSRLFELTFYLQNKKSHPVKCTILLQAALENLAAELLPIARSEEKSGCYVEVNFHLNHINMEGIHNHIEQIMFNIWGKERNYNQKVSFNPLLKGQNVDTVVTIDFNRLILEEQIDDLVEMIHYMVETLNQLQKLLTKES